MNDIVSYIANCIQWNIIFFSFLYQLKNVDSLLQGYMNPNSNQGPVWGRINKYVFIACSGLQLNLHNSASNQSPKVIIVEKNGKLNLY